MTSMLAIVVAILVMVGGITCGEPSLQVGAIAALLLVVASSSIARREFERREQVEAALRASHSKLRLSVEERNAQLGRQEEELEDLFESASIGLQILGTDGTILRANNAEMEMLGCTTDEYIGQNISEFHADPECCIELLECLNKMESVKDFPARLRHKDGSERNVLIDASARLKDGRFMAARVFTRDVTEKTWSNARLKESMREIDNLRAALDEHALVAITDAKGRITFVNDQFCAVSRYSREELLGQDHRIINSGHHPHEFMRDLWAVIRSGQVWKGEIKNRAKDGSYYWVDTTIVPFIGADGRPVQYIAIRNVITERKEALLHIERMTERLRLATQGSGVGIWDWDIERDMLRWDESMCRLYGWQSREMSGAIEMWESEVHTEDLEAVRQAVKLALRGEKLYDTSFRIIWPDGSIHHMRAHGIVQRDSVGKPLRMTGTNWDITDHLVLEEKLAASLHEKEILLKEIHHRVKNNMQVICSLLNLQSDQIGDPQALAAFRESQFRVKSMALLHEKLYQSENLAQINFAEYLESLMDYLFSSFGSKAAKVRRHVQVENVSLNLDTAIPCGLIVSELASNALKYAFPESADGEVILSMGLEDDGNYHLRFRDNGVGLPPDVECRQANSLGLQLVQMLTGQLHGQIERSNGPGLAYHISFQDKLQTAA